MLDYMDCIFTYLYGYPANSKVFGLQVFLERLGGREDAADVVDSFLEGRDVVPVDPADEGRHEEAHEERPGELLVGVFRTAYFRNDVRELLTGENFSC